MSMILIKLSFVSQTLFSKFFFEDQDHDQTQDFTMKFNNKKLYFTYLRCLPNLVSFRKVFIKIRILFTIGSGSGS